METNNTYIVSIRIKGEEINPVYIKNHYFIKCSNGKEYEAKLGRSEDSTFIKLLENNIAIKKKEGIDIFYYLVKPIRVILYFHSNHSVRKIIII